MKLGELKARADSVQQSRGFKYIASAVIVLAFIGVSVAAYVASASPVIQRSAETAPESTTGVGSTITNTDSAQLMLETVLKDARGPSGTIIGAGIVAIGALIVVWLGLGVTYSVLGLVLAVVAAPLWLFESTRDFSKLIMAIVILAAAFSALMQGARMLLSGKGPVRAIARNVLAEAVRLRLSIVFIVLLIFGLAALPGLLDADQPLRYRVQSFMQFGTGGSFWLIALLTVFFSVSTVSTEQRDKIIWQTMTKPVAPWRYLLGKWVGVAALAGVLLAVSSSGVFLFVEYLRNQPAIGEKEAFIAYADEGLSEDRLVLETQILSAQRTVEATEPELDEETIQSIIQRRIEQIRQSDPSYVFTPDIEAKFREDILKQNRMLYFAIDRSASRTFIFEGIDLPPDADVPLVLRYRIDSAANEPDRQYKLSFQLAGTAPIVRPTGLGHSHSLPLAPILILPADAREPMPRVILPDDPTFTRAMEAYKADRLPGAQYITAGEMIDNGRFAIQISNGQFAYQTDEAGRILSPVIIPNDEHIQFPGGGLAISYPAGSYHANYARTMAILWLKLAFLAMLGIFCSTFLSFPVASMVSFGVFLMAESAGYVRLAVDNYSTLGSDDQINFLKLAISFISYGVSWIFNVYADLKPVEKLVNGQMVGGVDMMVAGAVIGVWCFVLFFGSVLIFRKRELAIYSGQ
ncbi:MAG: ABC transporter permease [Phycisphaerales bacterium JB058]